MEFLSPEFRKHHTRLLFVGYILSGLVVGILVTFFVLEISGVSINRNGELLLNSIVFIDSHPDNGQIFIDGQLERTRAGNRTRLVLQDGQHFVEIQRPGYEIWQKRVYLEGGDVYHLKYPFLYPSELVQTSIDSYEAEAKVTQSPDRRWLMIQPRVDELRFELIDLDHDDLPRRNLNFELELPDSTTEPVAVEVVTWANDNRHFLIRLSFDDQLDQHWLLSTNKNDSPQLVPQRDGVGIDKIDLIDNKVKAVYVLYQDGQLFETDLTKDPNKPLSLVAENILAFASHGDDLLLYVQAQTDSPAKVIIDEDGQRYPLTELPDSDQQSSYALQLSRFDNDWYYLVGSNTETQLLLFENPLTDIKQYLPAQPVTKPSINGLISTAFSTNVRFVAASYDDGLYIYDFEDQRAYRYNIAGLAADYQVSWMDGHRLYGQIDDNLAIWEFDSLNQIELGQVSPDQDIFFDKNYDALYNLWLDELVEDPLLELIRTDLVISKP